jgi:type II secretory pathway component GspD/PulD (secretin)
MVVLPVLLIVAGWCPPAAAAEPPPAAAADRAQPDYHVYRLRHASAADAARTLEELFNGSNRRAARARIVAEPVTNSLIVSATPADLATIEALLTKIDVEEAAKGPSPSELRIFALKHREPDAGLEAALRMVIGTHDAARFVLDRGRRQVLVYGDRNTLDLVEALLTRLDDAGAAKPEPAAAGLEVRVFWVVSGPGRGDDARPPDVLKEAVPELGRLGLDRPRLAAQLAVNTTPDVRFEMAGVAALDTPFRLAVTGTVAERNEAAELDLSVTVTPSPAAKGAEDVCRLRGRATAPLDRPLVLGAVPAEALKSAFVVQVQRRKPAAPAAAPGKAGAVEFREAPWGKVFEWLTERTGLPVIVGDSRPTGTFTFMPPRPDHAYDVPEVIDILNDGLLGQKYLLLRGEHSFRLVPADEKIDPGLVPRVRAEELGQRGRTELVTLVLPLSSVPAEEVATEVKKMLGPFGEVVVLKRANELLLQDTAGNLRQVYKVLDDLDRGAKK